MFCTQSEISVSRNDRAPSLKPEVIPSLFIEKASLPTQRSGRCSSVVELGTCHLRPRFNSWLRADFCVFLITARDLIPAKLPVLSAKSAFKTVQSLLSTPLVKLGISYLRFDMPERHTGTIAKGNVSSTYGAEIQTFLVQRGGGGECSQS